MTILMGILSVVTVEVLYYVVSLIAVQMKTAMKRRILADASYFEVLIVMPVVLFEETLLLVT